MSEYLVNLPDGRQARVPIPDRLRVNVKTDAEARAAIRRYVTKQAASALEPLLKPRQASKEIVRDDSGAIVRLLDIPAATTAEVAAELGNAVADQYLSEIDW